MPLKYALLIIVLLLSIQARADDLKDYSFPLPRSVAAESEIAPLDEPVPAVCNLEVPEFALEVLAQLRFAPSKAGISEDEIVAGAQQRFAATPSDELKRQLTDTLRYLLARKFIDTPDSRYRITKLGSLCHYEATTSIDY